MDRDLALFKACADETRLRILVLLSRGALCVCEIVAVLDMPQGKVSRHLAVLRRAGLVEDERRGTWIHYSLGTATAPLMARVLAYVREEASRHDLARGDLLRLRALCENGTICTSSTPPACLPRARQEAAGVTAP